MTSPKLPCDACYKIHPREDIMKVLGPDEKYLGNLCVGCRKAGLAPKLTRIPRGHRPKVPSMTLTGSESPPPAPAEPAVDDQVDEQPRSTHQVLLGALLELRKERRRLTVAIDAISDLIERGEAPDAP